MQGCAATGLLRGESECTLYFLLLEKGVCWSTSGGSEDTSRLWLSACGTARCFRSKSLVVKLRQRAMCAAQAQLSRRWHCTTGQGAGILSCGLQQQSRVHCRDLVRWFQKSYRPFVPRLLLTAGSFQDWEPGEEEIQQESRDACAHTLLPEHTVLLGSQLSLQ